MRSRVVVHGKSLQLEGRPFRIRGVTYGPFRPDADGREYPAGAALRRDLAAMARHGLNALRTYTVPPRDLLDAAAEHGLRVLVGCEWEQHVVMPECRWRELASRLVRRIAPCREHPAVLGYAIGNEIPTGIVRWSGPRTIERLLAGLSDAVRDSDPGAIVTYANYPSTEYLDLPFLDLVTFNVYLHSNERLERYVARLHNIAGDRPLLIGELGFDSLRHGPRRQARMLERQLATILDGGGVGAFVFAWTDDWHRGGEDILDWRFGLTTALRQPKSALAAVERAFARPLFADENRWPAVSVVVCSYNGARTIRRTLAAVAALAYPDYEVIVVDDGSRDTTAAIADEFAGDRVRLVRQANAGLSAARNTGWRMARGEVVAYLDDDAWPEPDWLTHLVQALRRRRELAGVGGPNIPPPGDGPVAGAVGHAPGGPTHVLITDRQAEHIPGCNMAFRRDALAAIGGFDPQFRIAGDDVDVCWRLRDRGWQLGFSPAAVVWHHRRNSVRAFWRQQRNYGAAEAMLERKWPQRYNGIGHLTWAGRLYGRAYTSMLGGPRRIYHGTWGTAPFQSIYQGPAEGLAAIALLPEWYLALAIFVVVALFGAVTGPPMRFAALPAVAGLLLTLGRAATTAARTPVHAAENARGGQLRFRALVAYLHLVQPAARMWGRLRFGLTPWRRRGARGVALPWRQRLALWSTQWRGAEDRLAELEGALRDAGVVVAPGGEFDAWDLEVRGGAVGRTRLVLVAEEHGSGDQMVRVRLWPSVSGEALRLAALLLVAAGLIAIGGGYGAAAIVAAPVALLAVLGLSGCAASMATLLRLLDAEGFRR